MLTWLLLMGVLWIVLKVMISVVEIPFRFLGWLVRQPFATIFWVIILVLLVIYVL